MALINTQISLDGIRAVDTFDVEPRTVVRQATYAEQAKVLGLQTEVGRVGLGVQAQDRVHTVTNVLAGQVNTLTIA